MAVFFHGSGINSIIALANGIPFIYRNSNVLSSIAESEPCTSTIGKTFVISDEKYFESNVSSLASIRFALPLIVLISPL